MKKHFIIFLLLFCLSILFNAFVMGKKFDYPLTSIKPSPLSRFTVLDLSGYLFGSRRFVADLSWIQTLLYYATPEAEISKEEKYKETFSSVLAFFEPSVKHENEEKCSECHGHHHDHGSFEGGVFPDLAKYAYRTAYLDPFFDFNYLYSAGSLAWNQDRPEEAIELLKYGLERLEPYKAYYKKDVFDPFWRFNLYISAIIYKKGGKFEEMTILLEQAVKLPQAPNMVKTILANIYQKKGLYIPALKLWIEVYESNDPSIKSRAEEKINQLKALAGL